MLKRVTSCILVALLIIACVPIYSFATLNDSFKLLDELIDGTITGATVESIREVVNTSEYTKDNYKSVRCYEIRLSSIAENDNFTIALTPSGSMPSENFGNFPKIATVGYTYSDMITIDSSTEANPVEILIPGFDPGMFDPGMFETVTTPDYCISDDTIARICLDEETYHGTYSITLNNGKAQLVVFYYDFTSDGTKAYPTWKWEGDDNRTPYAIVVDFIVEGIAGNDVALVGATPSVGQFDREFELYSGSKEAFLIVPKGSDGVDVVFELSTADASLSVNGNAPAVVQEDKTISVHLSSSDLLEQNSKLSDTSKNKISIYHNGQVVNEYYVYVINQRFSDLPDKVVDYLCIGSQYTNVDDMFGDYGLRAARSLVGSNITTGNGYSGPVSLGNLGGYITYYYKEAITDNPANPYGIDFITFGNSVNGTGNFGEPGQVWVSEDCVEWYALAGGMHYDDTTLWDYSITYTKADDGTTIVSDSLGKTTSVAYSYPDFARYPLHRFSDTDATSITLSGINVGIQAGTNEYGNTLPKYEGFGYTDRGSIGTVLESESSNGWDEETLFENLARNVARNPYLSEYLNEQAETYSVPPDGMDLAWAVDADGQPVRFPNGIHYIKIVTASNIYNDAIGEKSTEVNMVRVARANDDDPVGKTDAPSDILIDGQHLALEEGKNVYSVAVHDLFDVKVTAPEGANIYINNNCAATASYDAIPMHKIIRVIVQEGEKEPWIAYINLSELQAEAGSLTLDANGGTVNGSATYTCAYDASMAGQPLPTPVHADETLTFNGWFIGQKRYTTFPEKPGNVTMTAQWKTPAPKPSENTINVSFRLIGSTKATQDVDLANGRFYGAEYVTWIPTTRYTVSENATVADLFLTATQAAGIRSEGADKGYVSTVYAPSGYALSEFTNGPRSGWMYTMDGVHTNAINTQTMHDGAVIVFHYVDDYAWEVEDWANLGGANWPQLSGNSQNYWNDWLQAPDSTGSASGLPSGTGIESQTGDKKDDKTEGAGGTTTDSNTVTADDGSQVTTVTEKTVETKENADGSVTEVVTEKTTTTVTAPDGSVTATESVVESETTTGSVKNADGSVTETEQTVEKVTETVTGPDGKQQTTVTETEETKQLNTTTGADGKVSGTGTYSAKTTVTGADGKATTAVTEGDVAVSTDDKGTVSAVTTAKTTTTAPDGTKTETVTVITEAEMANGTTGKVVTDEAGNTLSAEATVSQAALEAAMKGDGVIEIPVTVNPASGAAVRISLEGAAEGSKVWVEIGTTETAPGNVAYLKLAEGVTKLLTTCKTGSVIVPVTGDCEVIVKDNSKAFTDVEASAWYGDSVKFVTAREIFNGVGSGAFAPSATMNRAMAAQILYNLDGSARAGDGTRFSDVTAGDWFNGAVGWASGLGVINGYNGAYAPLDAVTRQDLVTILYRYAKQAAYDVSAGSSVDLTRYADGADVAGYAAEAMRWAIAVGLLKGYEDNTLRPTATATRAEVAALMQRMVQNAVK